MIKLILVPTDQEINYYSSIKSNVFKPQDVFVLIAITAGIALCGEVEIKDPTIHSDLTFV